MIRFVTAIVGLLTAALPAAELKVAALHPLLADLARQVGGEHVEVIDLIGPKGDPHHFEPSPADLQRAEEAKLFLAAGLGLEGYLGRLRSIVGKRAEIVEVGATLPVIHSDGEPCEHGHAHHHHGEVDPHWWHSIDRFRRAASVVAEHFATADPERGGTYRANAERYRETLEALERWTRREIARIPRPRRHLATAHAAFNYFCADFGFTAHPIQGLNREQTPDPKQLAALISRLKEHNVAAVFPEKESNQRFLQTLTNDTGIRLGKPLIADGAGSYEEMVRHNVRTIVEGLAPDAGAAP